MMCRRTITTCFLVAHVAAAATLLSACSGTPSQSPYAHTGDVTRDPERARELVGRAKEVWLTQPRQAEQILRNALAADLYCGPAHNNLGVLLLEQGKLYEAAGEFEWARRLMPGHPDPRVNLALTLERAGKTEDALASYDSALAVFGNYLPALQGRTRLEIATGRTNPQTFAALDEIAFRSSEDWRAWAQRWKSTLEARP